MPSARSVASALVRKGAVEDASRHRRFRRFVDDRLHAITLISHGRKEIGPSLMAAMARQCGLAPCQFRDLVDCSFTAEDWERALLARAS